MEVYLLRHGRTAANEKRHYCGSTDEALSPQGAAEAKSVRYPFSPERIYVTPLRRSQETAALIFPGVEQQIVPDLREMDFGAFEGRSAEEMAQDAAYRQWVESQCQLPCPGGESMAGFVQRVCAAFSQLVEAAIQAGTPQLCILAHGGSIMAIMSRYAQPSQDYFHWFAPNCGGYQARLEEADWAERPALLDWAALLPREDVSL